MFVSKKVEATTVDGKRQSPRAVVLVLGFGGAQPRHVAKHSDLYNRQGCSTVSGTASNKDVFLHGPSATGGMPKFASDAVRRVVELVRDQECDAVTNNDGASATAKGATRTAIPIAMHCISNGGAFVAKAIGHMLDARDKNDTEGDLDMFARRLRLQVFDSAPCYLDGDSAFRVMKQLIPNRYIGIPAAYAFSFASSMFPAQGRMFWEAMLNDANVGQQAFIYSNNDDIANAAKIEELVMERRKRGVHVMTKRFEDSMHVQHIRLHEIEYSEFIESALTAMEQRDNNDQGLRRSSSS